MSEARALLEQLCARCGVRTDYHDIWGRRHEVPEASLAAFAAEFGCDVTSPERAAEALRALEAQEAALALEPICVVRAEDARWRVALRLGPERVAPPLRWTLELEQGARHEGEAEAGAEAIAPGVPLPTGYHRLALADARGALGETLVVCAPERCWRPQALDDDARLWGPALQLYTLRSARNWGIGDFGDLARAVELFAGMGAGLIGLNPLHALFPHNPPHASPYSPSSRLRLNVLYLDVESIPDYAESEEVRGAVAAPAFQARLERLRAPELVDYPGVAAAKFEIFERLYAHFRAQHLAAPEASARAKAFREYQAAGGAALRRHALCEALQEHFHRADASVWGWPAWPEAYRDPQGEAVARFGAEHIERVEFYEYLQWQAEAQLARIRGRCDALGLTVGLYLDLAVSVDRAGSDAWAYRSCYAGDASIGAPPDDFNLSGQDWGLPPLRPDALRRTRHEIFIGALRESMRFAGALRIDHVMGLMRLFWIPPGGKAADGAYVHYPFDELAAIVALESHRNRCMVIGEDLGTVPDEVRAVLGRYDVLSYRLLYFEREQGGEFKPPAAYPREALVAVSTHDLPTLAGWWQGADIVLRESLGLYPDKAEHGRQTSARAEDRMRLLRALEREGLLPRGVRADAPPAALDAALVEAVHAYAAAAPARVMMMQLEDALEIVEQVNLPGTVDEHPNWRRKLPLALEDLDGEARLAALARRLALLRPHPSRATAAEGQAGAVIPRATYRLQLNAGFTFDDAVAIVPYLDALGVSHVYCSPILRARPGSLHGYDIVDHTSVNPELGGAEGFERLHAALQARGMSILLDIVPNHMAVFGADNAWWMDVLEDGPASAYAKYFDIDWQPVNADLWGKVLVPVLGDHYGDVLARGELRLEWERAAGSFAVRYYGHRFPVDPREFPAVLARAGELAAAVGSPEDVRAELSSLAAAFGHLPARGSEAAQARAERSRDKALLRRRLAQLAAADPRAEGAIAAAVADINTEPRDALHALLEAQAYRLAYWRVASDEINYRRFFDVNDLAALRIEDDDVFEATHAFALDLAARGQVAGLRVDHPDGLFDPASYFARLQEGYARRAGVALGPPENERPPRPLYVVAEKITARHEHVPPHWAVHGTTGYRFAAVVGALLTDGAARGRLDRIWRTFTGRDLDFEEVAYRGKRAVMMSALASELTVLGTELLRIARADRRTRDYTFYTLRQALAEVAACMPVYRTYLAPSPSPQDRRYIDWAVARATRRSRAADATVFGFVRQALLGQPPEGASEEYGAHLRRFAMKFQQFTAPLAAKGVEDTAFYVFNRLASLNEVGGDPDMFGMSVAAFHGASADRAANWPHTMLATSTHDNKRSEDVRLRIGVISEMPAAWRLLLRRWRTLNRARSAAARQAAPDPNDEYLLYQTLLGTFPADAADAAALDGYRERMAAYVVKAAREAKLRTSWINPDEDYERGLVEFVNRLLRTDRPNPFLDDLRAQAARVGWFGALNGLSMALIKFTSPGVPDLYQGNETIDLSLVDPDNRRAVDFAARARALEALRRIEQAVLPQEASRLAASCADGVAKLFVTARLLDLRRRRPALFRDGAYRPLAVSGAAAPHVVAYARVHEGETLVVIAGRLFARLLADPGRLPLGPEIWNDTAVEAPDPAPGTPLANVLTGESVAMRNGRIALADAFAHFPAAALYAAGAD